MSEGTSHFSKRTLQGSEWFTSNPAGRRLAWLATGSSLPTYRQLVWTSRLTVADIPAMAGEVAGDPQARGPARFWGKVAIVGAAEHDLTTLSSSLDLKPTESVVEAVAYTSEDVTYVGYHPQGESLLRPVSTPRDQSSTALSGVSGVAFRKGRGPGVFTVGYAVPEAGAFYGVEAPMVIPGADDVALRNLQTGYPGVLFVGLAVAAT